MTSLDISYRLSLAGVLLLFLALLTGGAVPHLVNPRMGLAAHTTGIQCALVLIAFGVLWPKLRVAGVAARLTYVVNVAGAYALWLAFVLGAALGAGRAAPISGAGHEASPAAEAVFACVLYLGVVSSVVGTAAVLLALARARGLWQAAA